LSEEATSRAVAMLPGEAHATFASNASKSAAQGLAL
jgi:hypothetical protein